jgi:hypothetical protein
MPFYRNISANERELAVIELTIALLRQTHAQALSLVPGPKISDWPLGSLFSRIFIDQSHTTLASKYYGATSGRFVRFPGRTSMIALAIALVTSLSFSVSESFAESTGGADPISHVGSKVIPIELMTTDSRQANARIEPAVVASQVDELRSIDPTITFEWVPRALYDWLDKDWERFEGQRFTLGAAIMAIVIGSVMLCTALLLSRPEVVIRPLHNTAKPAAARSKKTDYEEKCRFLLMSATMLWRDAEAAVCDLDRGLALRTLLMNELRLIAERLSANPVLRPEGQGHIAVSPTPDYWRNLSHDIRRTVSDLERICSVADAAQAGFGDRSNEPRMPTTAQEAYLVLGANHYADQDTIQRLVRALRQCWHPDMAQNDTDKSYREARIRQINVANDIIVQRRTI